MSVQNVNDSNFNQELSGCENVIVKYYADWCGSCKLFAPKYKRLSSDERFEGITFLEVNAGESPEARKLAGVDNLPFFAVFKNGNLVKGEATSKEENVVALLDVLKN